MIFYKSLCVAITLVVLAGCNVTLSGPSPQELLAIEQQRARVAAIFAIAKPYQHASESEQSNYNGPPRTASPSPSRTADAPKTGESEHAGDVGADSPAGVPELVTWHTTPRGARDAARSQKGPEKTVLVVVTGANCPPCERLKDNLQDPAAQAALSESFVCAMCDVKTLTFDEPPSLPIFVFVPAGAESDTDTVRLTPPTDVAGILDVLEQNR